MKPEPNYKWEHPETEEELIERLIYKCALSDAYIEMKGGDKWEHTEEHRLEVETYCNKYCKENYLIDKQIFVVGKKAEVVTKFIRTLTI